VSRGCEYAGDAADEAGKHAVVTGGPSRVEFSDRQRSHPLIARRCRDLVEGRSRVTAIGVLRQRSIDEIKDVHVEDVNDTEVASVLARRHRYAFDVVTPSARKPLSGHNARMEKEENPLPSIFNI
jgi:hypothetical protein